MSQQQVIHAYRHLYRHSLRAIQFSKPARYTLRDRLRLAFRRGSASDFEPQKVHNTLEFLQYARRENGLEHKIVKNLLFVWWLQSHGGHGKHKAKTLTRDELEIKTTAYDVFNHNIYEATNGTAASKPSESVLLPRTCTRP
ncbi:hypothetical protein BM1_02751 [Bipolaris maydis]|nr:hypothetical protein BM1_02751 [Bipolaris maydis]